MKMPGLGKVGWPRGDMGRTSKLMELFFWDAESTANYDAQLPMPIVPPKGHARQSNSRQ
jgi:hypothetical protein